MTHDSPTIDPNSRRKTYRRLMVIGLYVTAACWGLTRVLARENPLFTIGGGIAFATLATLWFKLDRRILDKPAVPVLTLIYILTWPIASMIHLAWTRGPRGFGYWLLNLIGLFATMCLTFYPTIMVLYWLGILELEPTEAP